MNGSIPCVLTLGKPLVYIYEIVSTLINLSTLDYQSLAEVRSMQISCVPALGRGNAHVPSIISQNSFGILAQCACARVYLCVTYIIYVQVAN